LNSNIPSFAQQQSGTFAPPPPPQRQPSSGPASGPTNPQQWTQQQAGQQQVQSANRGKAWAGHDFAKSNFPIPEDKFMGYLSQMLNIPNFTPPMIQNRAVDLYALFNLVHKNGGSVKVCRSSIMRPWLMISSKGMYQSGRRLRVYLDLARLPNLAPRPGRRPKSLFRSRLFTLNSSRGWKTCSTRPN
jgi:hypothetical protein